MSSEQADALGADRRPHLGRLGDPLDQLLGLLAGEQAAPDLVDQLAVQRLEQRVLDRVALERALHRLFDHRPLQHPGHRPLDRLAFDRGDDRLLGGDLDRLVDPGGAADRAGAADSDAQQPGREWRWPFSSGSPEVSERGVEPFSIPRRVYVGMR